MNKGEARSAVMEAISMTLKDSILQQGFTCICKELADLEKENAELKEIIDNDVDKKIYVQLAKKANLADMQKEQLTKAKEIIKKYLAIGVGGKITQNYLDVTKEAEQFLNSEVEK